MSLIEKLKDADWDHPEFMKPRGVGSNGGWKSLVTGEHVQFGPDMACFVASKEAGERLVEKLDGRAYLDFRPSEPRWIQLKLLVEKEHEDVLGRLYDALTATEGMFRPRLLLWALDPENHKGYEPLMLQKYKELRDKIDRVTKELS